MKKSLFLLLFVTATICVGFTQTNDRYVAAMTDVLEQLKGAPGEVNYQEVSNRLERIAGAEPGEWLPNYYLTYIDMQLAMQANEQGRGEDLQTHLAAADAHWSKASEVAGENSELACMKGYIHMGHIWIDPMTNGAVYSPQAQAAFQQSIAMDSSNPRPQMMRGMLTLFTPEFFGGGAENALPALEAARDLFEIETGTDRGLLPAWGLETNSWLLKKAEADLADKG